MLTNAPEKTLETKKRTMNEWFDQDYQETIKEWKDVRRGIPQDNKKEKEGIVDKIIKAIEENRRVI